MIVRELFSKLGFKVDDSGAKQFDATMSDLRAKMVKVGAAVAAAAGGIALLVKQTAAAADEIDKTAQATGLSRSALQELRHAADISGVGFEKLRASMNYLNRAAYLAAQGSKETGLAFSQLGVRFADANGQLRPGEELLGDLAEKFAAMPDGTQKSALAMRVFGEAGSAMVPLLSAGRGGIAALRQEAHDLGIVLSDETIAAGVEFTDTMARWRSALAGVRNVIAGPLLKPLTELAIRAVEWVKANREGIRLGVDVALRKVGAAAEMVAQRLRPLVSAARWAYERIGGLRGVAILASIAIGMQLASAVGTGALALAKFVAALKMASLWQAIAAAGPMAIGFAILALLFIVDEFVTALRGGDTLIGDFFAKFARPPDQEEHWLITFGRAFWATWGDIAVEVPKALAWWKARFLEFVAWLLKKVGSVNDAVGNAVKGTAKGLARGATRYGLGSVMPAGAADWAADRIFGGGGAPASAPAGVSPMTPIAPPSAGAPMSKTFAPTINVSAQTGASPDEIAGAIDEKLRAHTETWMRETADEVT